MTKRRWLKSAIATSNQPQPALPFQRTNRKLAAIRQAAPIQATHRKNCA